MKVTPKKDIKRNHVTFKKGRQYEAQPLPKGYDRWPVANRIVVYHDEFLEARGFIPVEIATSRNLWVEIKEEGKSEGRRQQAAEIAAEETSDKPGGQA
jgi:hypothetical protein